MNKVVNKTKNLNTTELSMLILSGIVGASGLSIIASDGYSSVLFYIFAILVFFIPSSIATYQLSIHHNSNNGLHSWANTAYNIKIANLSSFLQWGSQIFGIPSILIFSSTIFASYFNMPWLSNNTKDIAIISMFSTLILIGLNCLGVKFIARMAIFSSLSTYLIPIIVLISFALFNLLLKRNIPQASITNSFFAKPPSYSMNLIAISMVMLSGIDFAGFFISSAPIKTYRKSFITSVVIAAITPIIGCIALVILIPIPSIDPQSGLIQAIQSIKTNFNDHFTSSLLLLLQYTGQYALMSSAVLFATKSFLTWLNKSTFSDWINANNRFGVPYKALLLQGIAIIFLLLIVLIDQNINQIYLAFVSIMAAFSLLRYIILFASFHKLLPSKARIISPLGIAAVLLAVALLFCKIFTSISGRSIHYSLPTILILIALGIAYVYMRYFKRSSSHD